MKLLLFQLKLLIYLSSFVLDLILIQIKKAKMIFLIIFIILFIINLVFFYIVKAKINNVPIENKSSFSPARPEDYVKSEKTESDIRSEILFWEKVVEKQPNSRDALINLSILKRILLEDEEAKRLWNQAESIDPNNPIFKN